MSILQTLHFTVYHHGKLYSVSAEPYLLPSHNGRPLCFNATLDGKNIGDVNCTENKWENDALKDAALLSKIGSFICAQYP